MLLKSLNLVLFGSLLAYQSTGHATTNERSTFADSLSMDTCDRTPEKFYLNLNSDEFDMGSAISLAWMGIQTLDHLYGKSEGEKAEVLAKVEQGKMTLDKDADIEKYGTLWGFENIKVHDNDRFYVRYMLVDYQDASILTFRHTDSNGNWLSNADYGLWNFNDSFALGEKVHHGFARMLSSLWPSLVADVKERAKNGRKLWIYGHSLGASLATLAAPALKEEGVDIQQVILTGSPKVGSAAWVSKAKDIMGSTPIYRISNTTDLIARLPIHKDAMNEFRELFQFISDFFTRAIGSIREQMPYDVIGEEINIYGASETQRWSVEESIEQEKAFWLDMAEDFEDSDERAGDIKEFFSFRYAVLETNLSNHLMRRMTDGYSCSMTANFKNELGL